MIGRETRVTLGSGSVKTTGCDAGSPAIQARLSRCRGTIQQGPVQRQGTQIVQSCKTLDDFLPGFRPQAFRRADALGLWLEERVQPQVQLVMHSLEGDEAPVSLVTAPLVTEEGSCVSAETSSRLACDAEVVHIARAGDGSVLDVGRRQRSVGWRLRKALEARDGGCRFPGCGSRPGHPRPSHNPVGPGRRDLAEQPGAPVPLPPPRGPRRGLAGGDGRAGSAALFQPPRRPDARGARAPGRGSPVAARRPGMPGAGLWAFPLARAGRHR